MDKILRKHVLEKTNGRCSYCGRKLVGNLWPFIDHVIPIASGGTNEFKNLLPACDNCNSCKKNFSLEEHRNRVTVKEIYKKFTELLGLESRDVPVFTIKQLVFLERQGFFKSHFDYENVVFYFEELGLETLYE